MKTPALRSEELLDRCYAYDLTVLMLAIATIHISAALYVDCSM